MITHKKRHGTQPQLQLGAEVHIFSGNPATHSSIQVVSGSKAAYWSKAKLFDKQTLKKHWTQLTLQLGLKQLYFQKIQPPTRLDQYFLAIKPHLSAKLIALICSHQKFIGPNHNFSCGLRQLYFQEIYPQPIKKSSFLSKHSSLVKSKGIYLDTKTPKHALNQKNLQLGMTYLYIFRIFSHPLIQKSYFSLISRHHKID